MTSVYLDHNSTSPLRPEVLDHWIACQREARGNPSSLHASGRRARHRIDEARARVAAALGVDDDEIAFTASGTESNNLALGGIVSRSRDTTLVTSAVEHSSVLEPARAFAESGIHVVLVEPDTRGRVSADAILGAVADASGPVLVSLQAANNETGTLQPVAEVGAPLRERDAVTLHTDGVQALGRIEVDLRAWQVDLASFSVHKLGGPHGVGVLYRRNGTGLRPLFHGGGQEHGLRPGTENAPAIAAASLAVELAVREQHAYRERASALTRAMWEELSAAIPAARLVGPPIDAAERLPNTLTIVFPSSDGKVLVTALDLAGLEVSAGSACASGSVEPSHVLRAMKFDDDEARAGLRLSLGWSTTRADCTHAVDILRKVVASSRAT